MSKILKNKLSGQNLSGMMELNYRDLAIFLIPLAIFSYYLWALNPGIIAWDTYSQFHQIATGNFTTWHPFFHTFLLMMCVKTIGAPISYPILQILTFSTMWMAICKYGRDDGLKNSKSFYFQCIFTLIICLIPLNPLFSIYFYKDTLFSYFLMFLCFLIKVIVDKKGQISLGFLLVLCIVMSFVGQLRHNGLLIVLILLGVLAIYFYKNNRRQNLHIIIPVLTVVFILLISSLNVVYDVEDSQKDVVMSKTAHLLVNYNLNLDLNEDDKEKLGELINESTIKRDYYLTYSDRIYEFSLNRDVYENNREAYLFMAAEYSLKNPKHFIKYLFESAPIVWKIVKEDDWAHYEGLPQILPNNIRYYSYSKEIPSTDYDNATFNNMESQEYGNIAFTVNYVVSNELLYTLLDSPALYMYLSFIILAGFYLIIKSKVLFLVYLPNMINIILVFFSTPAPQLRYLYPNFLVFYMLIILVMGAYEKVKYNKTP